jgi:hypothetical protein
MPRAVVKNGVIYPLDPLPAEWTDGKEVWVEEAPRAAESPEEVDEWYRELEAMVAQNDPKDFERVEAALRRADEQAKEAMRKEMGLP